MKSIKRVILSLIASAITLQAQAGRGEYAAQVKELVWGHKGKIAASLAVLGLGYLIYKKYVKRTIVPQSMIAGYESSDGSFEHYNFENREVNKEISEEGTCYTGVETVENENNNAGDSTQSEDKLTSDVPTDSKNITDIGDREFTQFEDGMFHNDNPIIDEKTVKQIIEKINEEESRRPLKGKNLPKPLHLRKINGCACTIKKTHKLERIKDLEVLKTMKLCPKHRVHIIAYLIDSDVAKFKSELMENLLEIQFEALKKDQQKLPKSLKKVVVCADIYNNPIATDQQKVQALIQLSAYIAEYLLEESSKR